MIEGLVGLGIGFLLGGASVYYIKPAPEPQQAEEAEDDVVTVAASPAPVPVPKKRRVRTFVCHDGRRIHCHDREEQFHTPPENVTYWIDGEEDV